MSALKTLNSLTSPATAAHGQPVYLKASSNPNPSAYVRADGLRKFRSAYPNMSDVFPTTVTTPSVTPTGAQATLDGCNIVLGNSVGFFGFTGTVGAAEGHVPDIQASSMTLPTGSVVTDGSHNGWVIAWIPTLSRFIALSTNASAAPAQAPRLFDESLNNSNVWTQSTTVSFDVVAMWATPTKLVVWTGTQFQTTPLSGFANPSGANTQVWTAITPTQLTAFGTVKDIAYDYATDTWIATATNGGAGVYTIARSTDLTNWSQVAALPAADTNSLSNTVYAQCYGGEWMAWAAGGVGSTSATKLYHSTDGGLTWSTLASGPSGLPLAVVPCGDGTYTWLMSDLKYAQAVAAGTWPTSFATAAFSPGGSGAPKPAFAFKPALKFGCIYTAAKESSSTQLRATCLPITPSFFTTALASFNGYDAYIKV